MLISFTKSRKNHNFKTIKIFNFGGFNFIVTFEIWINLFCNKTALQKYHYLSKVLLQNVEMRHFDVSEQLSLISCCKRIIAKQIGSHVLVSKEMHRWSMVLVNDSV